MPRWGALRRLGRDQRGISAVEFALISPAFLTMLLGSLDLGHSLYLRAVMQGMIQKTARDLSLETGNTTTQQTALDGVMRKGIQTLIKVPDNKITITRRYFRDFTKAAASTAEPLTDSNANGRCDPGEQYQDSNNNGTWDKDGGDSGQGSAKDSVVYTVSVTYPRLFPVAKLIGLSNQATLTASTVLANQPYGDQASYNAPTTRICT
jgi:Flp pilus assembly protein TadG